MKKSRHRHPPYYHCTQRQLGGLVPPVLDFICGPESSRHSPAFGRPHGRTHRCRRRLTLRFFRWRLMRRRKKIHSSAATHIKYWIFTPFVSGCVQPASAEILPATSFERDVDADKIPSRSTDVTRTINYDDDDDDVDDRRPTLLETKTCSWSWTRKSWITTGVQKIR